MNTTIFEIVHSNNLPKNFRFQQFEGRKVFDGTNQDGSPRAEYVMMLLVAPEEISDYNLKKSDVIAQKAIVINHTEIITKSREDIVKLLRERIQGAISSLQEEINGK